MKNKDIYDLYCKIINTDFNSIKSAKVQYALVKNESILKREVINIEKTVEKMKSDNFKALHKELELLIKENPQKNQEEIVQQWEKRADYKKELDDFEKQIKEFDEIEVGVSLYLIPLDLVENLNEVNNQQMKVLFRLINESEAIN